MPIFRVTEGDRQMTMTRNEAKAEAAKLGVKFRVKDGEVHFYGEMPNTNQTGWYFVAWAA